MSAELQIVETKTAESAQATALSPHSQDEIDRVLREVEQIQVQMAEMITTSEAPASASSAPVDQVAVTPSSEVPATDRPKLFVIPSEEVKTEELKGVEPQSVANPLDGRGLGDVPESSDSRDGERVHPPEILESESILEMSSKGSSPMSSMMSEFAPAHSDEVPLEAGLAHLSEEKSVLSMSIQGSMTVQLNFGHKGESMTLDFNDDAVMLRLFNGMELRIPRSGF